MVRPTGRFDPELPPEGPRLVPNPVIVELEPAPPPPRRKTKPTLGSKMRRLEGKKLRGDVKALRGKPPQD